MRLPFPQKGHNGLSILNTPVRISDLIFILKFDTYKLPQVDPYVNQRPMPLQNLSLHRPKKKW